MGVRGAHLFSFLCCDVWWGSVVLIFLVFCVVVFGGAGSAHLFSFTVLWYLVGPVVLNLLAFCVVVFGGGLWCSPF